MTSRNFHRVTNCTEDQRDHCEHGMVPASGRSFPNTYFTRTDRATKGTSQLPPATMILNEVRVTDRTSVRALSPIRRYTFPSRSYICRFSGVSGCPLPHASGILVSVWSAFLSSSRASLKHATPLEWLQIAPRPPLLQNSNNIAGVAQPVQTGAFRWQASP